MSKEQSLSLGFSISTTILCSICILIRVYHHWKYRIKFSCLLLMGFCSIAFAILETFLLLLDVMDNFPNNQEQCTWLVKLTSAVFSLHRCFLYGFVVLRIQVIMRRSWSWELETGKWFVCIYCLSLIFTVFAVTKGNYEGDWRCHVRVDETAVITVMTVAFIIDTIICLGSTYLFLRPLLAVLRIFEDKALRRIARKEVWCVGTSLLCTIMTLIGVEVFQKSGIIIGIDCTITTICLLWLLSPAERNKRTKTLEDRYEENLLKSTTEVERIITDFDILASTFGEFELFPIDRTRTVPIRYLFRDSAVFPKEAQRSSI